MAGELVRNVVEHARTIATLQVRPASQAGTASSMPAISAMSVTRSREQLVCGRVRSLRDGVAWVSLPQPSVAPHRKVHHADGLFAVLFCSSARPRAAFGAPVMSDMADHVPRLRALLADPPHQVAGNGTVGLLQRVCGAAVHTLSASGAGVTMMTDHGVRGVCAASDPSAERLEELQFTLGEGPSLDAYASRRPLLVPELTDSAMTRWPVYAPTVHDNGVRAVFAFPLQVGAARLGVLDVFRDRAGALTADELRQALLLADVTVAALLDLHEQNGDRGSLDDLDDAIEGRAELFQAQGMVMVQLGVSIGDAMARMRAYAYAENRRLIEVARDIVARRLRFDPDHP